jgi:hypothetical protein
MLLSAASRGAEISADDFHALRDLVLQQGKRLDELEQAHQADQKKLQESHQQHERDQQQIESLKRQLQSAPVTPAQSTVLAENPPPAIQPIHALPPTAAASHNFLVAGDAEVQFGKVDGSHSAFALADFAPIFLFRAHDKILFEAGFDMNLQNTSTPTAAGGLHDTGTGTAIDLTFATLDYAFSDYSTFVGGLMLLPLGTYSERSAGWLNKIPDDPLPRDLVPGGGVGVQFRGALPLDDYGQSLTYAVYAANGPSSSDGSANHDQLDLSGNVGILGNGNPGNLQGSPSAGGRIGWFKPWKPHYDLELGLSGQSGTWDDADQHQWSAAVLDGALHLGSNIEIKGEYIQTWLGTADVGTLHPHGWWLQAGYKLAGLNLDAPWVNNLELVGRYDNKHDSAQGINTDRYTVGYVYYFSNTLLFEGDYEFHHSNDAAENHNLFVFQLSYGF